MNYVKIVYLRNITPVRTQKPLKKLRIILILIDNE